MNNFYKIFFICFGIILIGNEQLKAQILGVKMGAFETFEDIGAPHIKGFASYHEPSQTYHITASGENVWYKEDSFSFLSKKMNGDFIMQTKIRFIGEGNIAHRKAGLMIRSSNDANSAAIVCTVHGGDGLTSLQYRSKTDEMMKEIRFKAVGPDVLQLEKKGNKFIMSVAHQGETYEIQTIEDIDLGTDLLAGLFVCSHSDKFLEEVEFKNTRIFNPAPDDLVQYQTYINSLLEVVNVGDGDRKIIGSSEEAWQSPNWAPDGKTIMYNKNGKLYNFNIGSGKSSLINTDFAIKNNNDHVLSWDGKQIGLSHNPETTYQSVVYTVSSEGGTPKEITDKNPSYFHGWSPDNQFLIYTGDRNKNFDIYKISKDGGKEIRLTKSPALDDGSEYSPDGKYIYFCSTRTGKMQIWRMDDDGKNQIQLTFDDYNNWFPHVSPDNKWLAFISFPKEIPADKHPFYQKVYLRLIPVAGGEPKVISYVYGGQGTLNVQSWSPDSKSIAFISNGNFN